MHDGILISVVFGFLEDSFIGMEQGQGYTVQVAYLKGADAATTNLQFNVQDIPGTAREFIVVCSVSNHLQ